MMVFPIVARRVVIRRRIRVTVGPRSRRPGPTACCHTACRTAHRRRSTCRTSRAQASPPLARAPAPADLVDHAGGRAPGKPGAQLALDNRPISRAVLVELLHKHQCPRPQPARHLVEVRLRHLPHRAIELEILQRPQHQSLLAREHGSGTLGERFAGHNRQVADERRHHAVEARRSQAGRGDREADEDKMLGRGLTGHDDRDGRSHQRRQHEEVRGAERRGPLGRTCRDLAHPGNRCVTGAH